MCILFLVVDTNPSPGGYKLILASNRDEFYSRPATQADQWSRNNDENEETFSMENTVFGGRDMEPGREGGTWLALGVDKRKQIFRVGALLNLTGEPKRNGALGRGPLVANYVAGSLNNIDYSNRLINEEDVYNSFNMVSVEIE